MVANLRRSVVRRQDLIIEAANISGLKIPIYLDNHATTPVDPRVMETMLPYFTETFANAGSVTHAPGHAARDAVDAARHQIAQAIGSRSNEIVFTGGATESNNLAIKGVAQRHGDRGRHIVSVVTEHPAVLDPLKTLARRGFEITLVPVTLDGEERAGLLDIQQLGDAIRDDTILVSVMLANNEIGVIQALAEIGQLCRERGVLLHSDATQAVGKIPVNVDDLQVDLMSFSGHKIYGPKGIGALYVRHTPRRVRLEPQIDGGGQKRGFRSGTLNTPGIVGFARAVEICCQQMPSEAQWLGQLRDRLYVGLQAAIDGMMLNGPALSPSGRRLPGNLNVSFAGVQGETLLLNVPELTLSSGIACMSANPEPSHVLRGLGIPDDRVRNSIRFGLGRFNTREEIDFAVAKITDAVARLRTMSSGNIAP